MNTRKRLEMPVGTTDPAKEKEDVAVAQARVRKLSGSSQGHICTRCYSPSLVRYRRPIYLRLLRLGGLDLRTYQCGMCGHKCVVRSPSTSEPEHKSKWIEPANHD